MNPMNEKEQKAFDAIPAAPADAVFKLERVITHVDPHPYCITPRHVVEAADHHGGMLTSEAIRAAEKKGVACDICRKERGGILSYDDHKSMLVAMIRVPAGTEGKKLNDVPGLNAYPVKIKEVAVAAGIDGFGFPS